MHQQEIQWYESKEVWMSAISGIVTVLLAIQKFTHTEKTHDDIDTIHSFLQGLLGSLQLG